MKGENSWARELACCVECHHIYLASRVDIEIGSPLAKSACRKNRGLSPRFIEVSGVGHSESTVMGCVAGKCLKIFRQGTWGTNRPGLSVEKSQ